jgi:hypothetical protein
VSHYFKFLLYYVIIRHIEIIVKTMPKQKLSIKARAAKKVRDLAAANTTRRKRMRAENQRKRRAAIKAGKNIKGKDYDHKTKRFTTVKANRGNRGHGTRKE